jgi:hypothetical protein
MKYESVYKMCMYICFCIYAVTRLLYVMSFESACMCKYIYLHTFLFACTNTYILTYIFTYTIIYIHAQEQETDIHKACRVKWFVNTGVMFNASIHAAVKRSDFSTFRDGWDWSIYHLIQVYKYIYIYIYIYIRVYIHTHTYDYMYIHTT